MKITKLTIIVILVLTATVIVKYACGSISWFGLRGNGHVVKIEREATSFNTVEIAGVFHVYLTQGDKEKVEVETDENLQDVVVTDFTDNMVAVKWKKGTSVRKSTKMNVYITVRKINTLDIGGVSDVECSNELNVDSLALTNKGVGDVVLQLKGRKLQASLKSVGNLTLKGEVDDADIKNTGVGNLKAFDFLTQTMHIKNAGVGNVNVRADKELSIESTGVGNVRYAGNAVIKEIKTSGVGSVRKAD